MGLGRSPHSLRVSRRHTAARRRSCQPAPRPHQTVVHSSAIFLADSTTTPFPFPPRSPRALPPLPPNSSGRGGPGQSAQAAPRGAQSPVSGPRPSLVLSSWRPRESGEARSGARIWSDAASLGAPLRGVGPRAEKAPDVAPGPRARALRKVPAQRSRYRSSNPEGSRAASAQCVRTRTVLNSFFSLPYSLLN